MGPTHETNISGLNNGDEKAFHEIFNAFHSRLCFFAAGIVGDNISAEDLVQNAFVSLWQKRGDFNSPESVKSFLYIAVKNQCLNALRHGKMVKSKRSDILMARLVETDDHPIVESEVLEKLFTAILDLPQGCRSVLHLGYFKKMKNHEIAEYLKISINTVKTQKKRALQLLRGLMKYPACWFLFFLIKGKIHHRF